MNRPLKIGVDVDDILNDFFPHWIESWNKINGSNYDPQTVYQWDLTKFIPGYEWDEFLKVIDSQEFYDTLYPSAVGMLILKELQNNGAEIFLISGTYANNVDKKDKWIKKYFSFIPEKQIMYIKPEFKHMVNVDVMIEDCPIGLEKYTCSVLLMNKTYNQDTTLDSKANIHRVNGWKDIRKIFVEKNDIGQDYKISNDLLDVLMNCESKAEFNEILIPYFDDSYKLGYSTAMSHVAEFIKKTLE